MPNPINLAQGFFNLSNPDPLSQFGNVVTGNVDLTSLLGTPTSSFTNSLSLNNPTLLGEAWSQLSPYIPLPGLSIPPEALAVMARIPLPSNFVSRVPSTYSIRYPMPSVPIVQPSIPASPMREPSGAGNSPLTRFLKAVKERDFAFKSKYKIILPTSVGISNPTSIVGSGNTGAETVSLFCEHAELPGISYNTSPFRVYGPAYERPTSVSYGGENMTLVFLVDQGFEVKRYFDAWIALIADQGKYQFNYPDKYLSSGIIITQLKHRDVALQDSGDIGVYSVRLIDAYPKMILPMTVNGGDRDMHRLSVTFTYRLWVPVYGEGEPTFGYGEQDFVGVQSSTQ